MTANLLFGCCLEEMKEIPSGSVDAVITDLPYGTTYAKWDSIIPFKPLWAEYKRVCRKGAVMVFTASQPFTSMLVTSNLKAFRCEWVWNKVNAANFANANRQPLKIHESVIVFCDRQPTYYPQKVPGAKNHIQGCSKEKRTETMLIRKRVNCDLSGMKFPKSIIEFPKHSSQCGLHPTQKPVALMEYLLRTYTRPGETVLDNTMGSGTTGVACINLGRNFIGIEKDPEIFLRAKARIEGCLSQSTPIPPTPTPPLS